MECSAIRGSLSRRNAGSGPELFEDQTKYEQSILSFLAYRR
jgi:hypothetical protein